MVSVGLRTFIKFQLIVRFRFFMIDSNTSSVMSVDDDSSREISEDSVFEVDTSPSEASHCFQSATRSKHPVSLRGRVYVIPRITTNQCYIMSVGLAKTKVKDCEV